MLYLNEKTQQICTIVERTLALTPFCIVEYRDGTKRKEHSADLKRIIEQMPKSPNDTHNLYSFGLRIPMKMKRRLEAVKDVTEKSMTGIIRDAIRIHLDTVYPTIATPEQPEELEEVI